MRSYDDFDGEELWNLDATIAAFVEPRLRRFLAEADQHPSECSSLEEWQSILAAMIDAFAAIREIGLTPRKDERIERGLDLFRRFFRALWN